MKKLLLFCFLFPLVVWAQTGMVTGTISGDEGKLELASVPLFVMLAKRTANKR